MHQPRRRGPLLRPRNVVAVGVVALLISSAAVATDTLRAGYYFGRVVARAELFLNPPPDRETAVTVDSTPRPRGSAAAASEAAPSGGVTAAGASIAPSTAPASGSSFAPGASATASAGSSTAASASRAPHATKAPTASPTASPTPAPSVGPVKFTIAPNPDAVFAHELTKEWCAVAGTQIVLTILGKADTSDAFQTRLAGRIGEWESRRDSLDGGWGPGAIALALKAYGVTGYEVRAYQTRDDALLDAALSIADTHEPAVLLTWRGAHTWVMTGYMATGDITTDATATLTNVQILDPWYPNISSIWGASHRPGFYQTVQEMAVDYLPWERPEGNYPDRDGKFIAVVPTKPA